MIKTQNKLHLVTLTSVLLLSSIGINGIGNHVSFADTSKLVNDVQNAKEKAQYNAERVYSDTIAKAELNYAKVVELANDNPDKLIPMRKLNPNSHIKVNNQKFLNTL